MLQKHLILHMYMSEQFNKTVKMLKGVFSIKAVWQMYRNGGVKDWDCQRLAMKPQSSLTLLFHRFLLLIILLTVISWQWNLGKEYFFNFPEKLWFIAYGRIKNLIISLSDFFFFLIVMSACQKILYTKYTNFLNMCFVFVKTLQNTKMRKICGRKY